MKENSQRRDKKEESDERVRVRQREKSGQRRRKDERVRTRERIKSSKELINMKINLKNKDYLVFF